MYPLINYELLIQFMGGGGGRGAEGGFFHTLEQKSSHCVLMEGQKAVQCTCQAEMVIGSSFTPR